jgi:hypothetical protein
MHRDEPFKVLAALTICHARHRSLTTGTVAQASEENETQGGARQHISTGSEVVSGSASMLVAVHLTLLGILGSSKFTLRHDCYPSNVELLVLFVFEVPAANVLSLTLSISIIQHITLHTPPRPP